MAKIQYTPGPWTTSIHYSGAEVYGGNVCVADVYGKDKKANARLIAAAPAYYEACHDLPRIMEGETTRAYHSRVLTWFYASAAKIYAANIKATGE